MKIDN